MRTLVALLLVSSFLLGQQPELPPAAAHLQFTGVWLDQPTGAPVLRARGETYKMEFEAGRATYYPRLAAEAARHWPVTFQLLAMNCGVRALPSGTGTVRRAGDRRVEIDRGSALEVWDLAADHAEQSFVFAQCPGHGELRLAIGCNTAMGARASDGELQFDAPGGGGVRCREAIAKDAAGRAVRLLPGWEAGQMILQVPAEFLGKAVWPVVVDPIVSTTAVHTAPGELLRAQASYDANFDVWLVVCEEAVTANDHDVLVFRLAQNGTVLDNSAVELSPVKALSPDVAATGQNGQFLLAWIEQGNSVLARRYRAAGGTSYGPQVNRGIGFVAPNALVAVGGSRTGDLNLLSWTDSFPSSQSVTAAVVDIFNNLGPTVAITGNVPSIHSLDVTDRTGPGAHWGMVVRSTAACEFYGLQAAATVGPLTVSPPVLVAQGGLSPAIAGTGPFLVASLDAANPPAIRAAMIGTQSIFSFGITFTANLSVLENPTGTITNRSDLALASDGSRFVYSFREDHATTPTATVLNTIRQVPLGLGFSFAFDERRIGLGRVGPEPSLCAAGATGGPAGAYLLLETSAGANSSLSATRYDGRVAGDMFTAVVTRCGAPFAPLIGVSGFSVLGGEYVVRLSRTVGAPILLAGFPEATPVPICNGNPACLRGVRLPAPTALLGDTLVVSIPNAAGLLGTGLAFQGLDLLGPGGCPASAFGFDVRLSDTITATVR